MLHVTRIYSSLVMARSLLSRRKVAIHDLDLFRPEPLVYESWYSFCFLVFISSYYSLVIFYVHFFAGQISIDHMEVLKQAQADGVVIGLKDVAGVVPRLDVDLLLLNEPNTFNLFLLALQSLQSEKDSEDKMAYFKIAGPLPSLKCD